MSHVISSTLKPIPYESVKRHYLLPFGAEPTRDGTRFRLWAPDANSVAVIADSLDGPVRTPMTRRNGGWYECLAATICPGALYRFRIDDEIDVPDPASRFNPQGLQGRSEVIDPQVFEWDVQSWQSRPWKGRPWQEAVLYELHVGTFTPQGTFAAIIPRLQEIADLGVTCLELLPIATFSGKRGWGYDGVLPFAPHPAYGRPEDFKALIQAAHAVGLSVVLDVVYNHFGPEGNYLYRYAREFFTDRHHTPWGAAINFEGTAGRQVRDFFIHNAMYWIEEYQLDGLRLDAIHAIKDDSPVHFVDELAQTIALGPARDRHIHLILENHHNQVSCLRDSVLPGGVSSHLSKAQWNDDSHHALHVLVTDETDGYYSDYADPVTQTGRILAEGFAYQGELSAAGGNQARGERSRDLPPTAFINFLQNHDQIGNRALGERMAQIAQPQRLRAAMALVLLSPQPPLLFMGEEYAATQPFLYFCDYQGELADAITNGRRNEFAQFRAFASEEARASIPDPNAESTFERSRLHWEERSSSAHLQSLQFTQALLRLRHERIVPLISLVATGQSSFIVDDRLLSVRWPLVDARVLSLRVNFSASPLNTPAHAGELLYAGDATGSSNVMMPWDVQLWLSPS